VYRRRASPLHAARAGIAAAYGLALVVLALSVTSPVLLGGVAAAAVLAGVLAGVGGDLARAARFAVPLALLLAVVNALVVREGLTVIWRFGEVGPLGQVDVTLEALVYGLLLGLRVVVVILAFALLTATVNPDEVLRALRRVSLRSALTAALATRMLPVLGRDARRMDEALRCRPGYDAGAARTRLAVVRALTGGALDRAVDVAATLELRGYATARRPPREPGPPLSRHDLGVGAAAAALLALATVLVVTGAGRTDPYPRLDLGAPLAVQALAALVLVAVALAPFAARRGTLR
jgi:energy-coupling factor transport system permease protein